MPLICEDKVIQIGIGTMYPVTVEILAVGPKSQSTSRRISFLPARLCSPTKCHMRWTFIELSQDTTALICLAPSREFLSQRATDIDAQNRS